MGDPPSGPNHDLLADEIRLEEGKRHSDEHLVTPTTSVGDAV